MAEQLGDRVKHYFTINEFASFVEGGYQGIDVQVGGGKTVHLGAAPGSALRLRAEAGTTPRCAGPRPRCVQAIRAGGPAGAKVGFAENMRVAVPLLDTPEYVQAAEQATRDGTPAS